MTKFLLLLACAALASAVRPKTIRRRDVFSLSFGGCQDAIANCASYDQSVCTNAAYKQWAQQNCQQTCNLCGGGTGSGSVPVPQTGGTGSIPMPQTGGSTGGFQTAAPQIISGGGQTGGTMTGSCADTAPNCAAYGQAVCSNTMYADWVEKNCQKFCNKCPGGGSSMVQPPLPGGNPNMGSSSCQDAMPNCAAYGSATCTNPQYTQWAQQNCAKFCQLCPGGSPSNMGPTAAPGGQVGQSRGCAYQGQVYQQGQKWSDACKYNCECTDGSTGKYMCRDKCVTWNLPQECHMNPPAAGKCCPTPACPPNYNIQYPAGYTAE